jgi:hypothetical protein
MKMAEVTMTMEEYLQLINGLSSKMPSREIDGMQSAVSMPKKRKTTAYQRRYKANFKKVSKRFKLKSGKWKKNGFKSAVKLAHKMSKK